MAAFLGLEREVAGGRSQNTADGQAEGWSDVTGFVLSKSLWLLHEGWILRGCGDMRKLLLLFR